MAVRLAEQQPVTHQQRTLDECELLAFASIDLHDLDNWTPEECTVEVEQQHTGAPLASLSFSTDSGSFTLPGWTVQALEALSDAAARAALNLVARTHKEPR